MYWFLYDSSGNIKESQIVNVIEWTNLNGYTGVISFPLTNSVAQAAYLNSALYLVQENQLVQTINYMQIQLEQAQQTQITLINTGLNQTLNGGFTSKTTGHQYVTTINGQTNMEGDLKRFELDSTLTSVQFYTTDAGWVPHTQSQLQSAFLDGGKWKDAQYAHAHDLINQLNILINTPGVTISQIQSVVWTPMTY